MNIIRKIIFSTLLALSMTGLTTGLPAFAQTAPTLTAITVTPESAVLEVGNSTWFTALGTYSDGAIRRLPLYKAYLTSTLLENGKVLVAGGWDGGSTPMSTAEAELYDPITGTFSRTGVMTTMRDSHTATRLTDGKVLVTGGWADVPVINSAELYNPATGTFIATGSMTGSRGLHTATLLADGRVLVTGGRSNTELAAATAELYDPVTGTFSATGSMIAARDSHIATLLADGRVLITGGYTDTGEPLATAELYDPATGTFSAAGAMAVARTNYAAARLADGKVLVSGGYTGTPEYTATAELYDPATNTFSATGSMVAPRIEHTVTLLENGKVLIAGGGPDSSAELYDPATGTFSATGSMVAWRYGHTAVLLGNGNVLAVGGGDGMAELYNTQAGTWLDAGYTLGDPLVWSNSDPSIAAGEYWDGMYYLTGLLPGTTTITATSGAISGSALLTIGYPPAVTFSPGQFVAPGEIVQLVGSATDDGYIASYAWTQYWGIPAVTLNDSNTATASFTAPYTDDTLWFQLTVTDDIGLTAIANTYVIVTTSTSSTTTSSTTSTTLPPSTGGQGNVATYCVACHDGLIVNGTVIGGGARTCPDRGYDGWMNTITRMNSKGCGVPSNLIPAMASYLASLETSTSSTSSTSTTSSSTTTSSTTTTTVPVTCTSAISGCTDAVTYCTGCHNGLTVNGYAVGGGARSCPQRTVTEWTNTIERMNAKGCGVPSNLVSGIANYLAGLGMGGSSTSPTTTTTSSTVVATTTAAPTTTTIATTTTTTLCRTHVNGTTEYPYSGSGSCHGHNDDGAGQHTVHEEKWCQKHMDHFNNAGNHTHAYPHPLCM